MDGLTVHREVEKPPHFAFAFVFAVATCLSSFAAGGGPASVFVVAFRCCLYV
jgi:hypothetical protein